MDRSTSLTRLRVRLLTWRISLLRQLAERADQHQRPRLAGHLTVRAWRLETRHFRQRHLLGPRPQMWLETHPPQDQPNPTPSSSS